MSNIWSVLTLWPAMYTTYWQNDIAPQDIHRNLDYAKEYYFSNDLLDIWYKKL